MKHKAGFVNIIGLPNVGKSTLMNELVGERMSIISPKAQTTRHRILGMVNAEDYQIVFSDTPGYINQPAYKLQSTMNHFVENAFEDADVLIFVTDKFQKDDEQAHLLELIKTKGIPTFVLLNKIDLYQKDETEALVAAWKEKLPNCEIIPITASSGINSKKVIKKIVELLPEAPPYFDKDQLTDRNTRFFVSEIVREKIFLNYTKEIPYSCEVIVETYKEEEAIDRIRCVIFIERESQKGIIIGNKGEALKKVGTEARKDIEEFIGKKVHLELFVKVKDKWRDNAGTLRNFGYDAG
ncbi:MAG TPA: GTPase Era [Chitinophagales bacterium]|nr:GTPase Era [Chitinophagales bacterium]